MILQKKNKNKMKTEIFYEKLGVGNEKKRYILKNDSLKCALAQ